MTLPSLFCELITISLLSSMVESFDVSQWHATDPSLFADLTRIPGLSLTPHLALEQNPLGFN